MRERNIIWSPIYNELAEVISKANPIGLVIAPYIKVDALEKLISLGHGPKTAVIVRWRPEDLADKVSDLSIYKFLSEKNIKLYYNHEIHLKIVTYGNDQFLCSSGNVTKRGLGLAQKHNVEAGVAGTMTLGDQIQFSSFLKECNLVDEEVYAAYDEWLQNLPEVENTPLPPLTLPSSSDRKYLLSMLPASANPEDLISYCSNNGPHKPNYSMEFAHDIIEYNLDHGKTKEQLEQKLVLEFKKNPFVTAIIKHLKHEQSLSFGAMASYIHNNCKDVPAPYRRDVKSCTANLFEWLEFFYDEISWNRPNYSQVIYWNE